MLDDVFFRASISQHMTGWDASNIDDNALCQLSVLFVFDKTVRV